MAAIIFDMDGTIADSFDYVADFMAKEAGLPPLNKEQKTHLRKMSMAAMARKLGYHWWQAPWLFLKGRHRMHQVIRHLDSFEGMPKLIRKLHNEGHELFVVSTNSLRNVRHFLHQQKIHKYFLEIYGGVGMFTKSFALEQLILSNGIERENAVYVGDERRDVEAAKLIGLKTVAVSWGFAGRDHLEDAEPTAVADTPAQLMAILEEI